MENNFYTVYSDYGSFPSPSISSPLPYPPNSILSFFIFLFRKQAKKTNKQKPHKLQKTNKKIE